MNDSTSHNDLAWKAFRYIAGEMNPDEVVDFEDRLGEDQAARDAVADAVELTQATCAALAPQPMRSTADSHAVSTWWYGVAAGVAACLLVMFAIGQLIRPANQAATADSDEPSGESVDVPADGALAVRWSEVRLRESPSEDDWPSDVDDWSIEDSVDEARLAEEHSRQAADATSAPAWMLAAVAHARQDGDDMMDDMDRERAVDPAVEQ